MSTRAAPAPTAQAGGGGGGGVSVRHPNPELDLQQDDVEAAERDILNSERDVEGELLEQLQELHRQLAEVRLRSRHEDRERRLFEASSKLIVCANGKPVKLSRSKDGGGTWTMTGSKGRFKSAIDSLTETNNVRWVSWPGMHVDFGSQEAIRKKLESEYSTTPVFLQPDIAELFYNKFCHGVLWPLFHCINSDNFNEGLLEGFMEQYEAYAHANQCYTEVVADIYESGDLVLVLDYELMLLPMLLRKRVPDVVCGFFLHCPFPSSEFYRMLPVRQPLLQGILGADLVSFNHFDYVRHFLNSCTRILGLESFPSRVEHNGRLVSLSICPAGIQPEDYEITPEVEKHMETLSARYAGRRIIVSMDRLDPCKGIPQKLMALDSLLENYPEWRGNVVMFAIVKDRKRSDDRDLGRMVDTLVGRVNGRFGNVDYCPVNYVKGDPPLTNEEVVALNALADVKLVTSVREGISLGAMEFIACQQHTRHGVLVYSEFAGCSTDFKGALIINPYDADKVAESINVALTMSSTTKQIRHHQLSRYVNTYTSALWARRMISSLQQAGEKAREYNQLQRVDMNYLSTFFERSRKRLLIFDYDGTLVQYHSLPQLAAPSSEIVQALTELCEDPCNLVFVISGRRKEDLQEWLGHIPQLGLLAENGYWCRIPSELTVRAQGLEEDFYLRKDVSMHLEEGGHLPRKDSRESPMVSSLTPSMEGLNVEAAELEEVAQPPSHMPSLTLDSMTSAIFTEQSSQVGACDGWIIKKGHFDLSWKDEVMDILRSFTERTPGSFLEVKDSCLSWHYRDTDPDFGMSQAKTLHQHLDQMLKHQPVRVITCPLKRYIVIHPSRLNKGRALVQVLEEFGASASNNLDISTSGSSMDFDFVLVIGDERTDEDMFDVLQGSTGFAVLRSKHRVSKFVPGVARGHCFTVTVGRKISRAQYYLDDPKEVNRMTQILAERSQALALIRERERENALMRTESALSMAALNLAAAAAAREGFGGGTGPE